MSDDYLWERTGEPDPDVRQLEEALGGLRYEREAPTLSAGPRRRRWIWTGAAAAVLAVGLAIGLRGHEPNVPPDPDATPPPTSKAFFACDVDAGGMCTATPGRLEVGKWLETQAGQKARVDVADIGVLTVGEKSRLQLVATSDHQHRMRLERGAIHAVVNAPPRLFIVETPAAEAVDLGCEYTLVVDEDGDGRLVVTKGWVALERDGRSSVVPYDALCDFHKDKGPGTPYFGDAPQALREALQRIDVGERDVAHLKAVMQGARKRDTLTLFHLLPRYDGRNRERIYDRMAALVPAPEETTRTGTLALDAKMLESWLEELRWEAWD